MAKKNLIHVDGKLFLGRVEEQKQFRTALNEILIPQSAMDETLPYVFLLYGDGGIGKSTLSKRFRDIATYEQPYEGECQILWVDWEYEQKSFQGLKIGREYITPETVFEVLYNISIRKDWQKYFKQYNNVRGQYQLTEKQVNEVLSINDDKDEFSILRSTGAATLAKILRTGLPIGETGEKFAEAFLDAGIKVGAEQALRIKKFIETKLKSKLTKESFDLFLNPTESLARAFAEGLKRLSENLPLVIFFDTYEIVDRTDFWIRMIIQSAGPKIIWVLSGRNDLSNSRQFGSEYFKGYVEDFPQRLLEFDVRQLALDDVRTYFANRIPNRPLKHSEVDAIRRATRGIPLAMEQVAEMWMKNIDMVDIIGDTVDATPQKEIVRKMTERYLLHVVNKEDKRSIYALALARGDIEALRAMIHLSQKTDLDLETHLQRLERDYASVYAGEAKLHDEPYHFIKQYLKSELRRKSEEVIALNKQGLESCKTRLQMIESGLQSSEEMCNDEDWVHLVVEITNYYFWLNEEDAWRWLAPYFIESIMYNSNLRHGLLQVITDWDIYLSARGKKLLKSLASFSRKHSSDHEAINEKINLLDELAHYIGNENEREVERKSILQFTKGLLLYQKGDLDSAFNFYKTSCVNAKKEWVKINEQLKSGLLSLAENYKQNKSFQQALEVLEYSVSIYSESAQHYHELGHVLRGLKQKEKAETAFKSAINFEANTPWHYFCLGNLHKDNGKYLIALDEYKKAVEINPNYSSAWNGIGLVYKALHDFPKSEKAFQEAINCDQSGEIPRSNLGGLYTDTGRFKDAIKTLEVPSHKQSAIVRIELARTYREMGNIEKSFNIIQNVITDNISDDLDEAYHELGHIEESKGNIEKAASAFIKSSELNQDNSMHLACLSRLYRNVGNIKEASLSIEKALKIDPNDSFVYHQLAHLHEIQGEEKEAIDCFKKAIELEPLDDTVLMCLGELYRETGEYMEALRVFSATLNLNPHNQSIYNHLGNAYSDIDDTEKAISTYLEGLSINPDNDLLLNNLGINYLRIGEIEKALEVFKKSIQFDENSLYANISLITCYRKINKESKARKYIKISKKLLENSIEYYRACYESVIGEVDTAIALLRIALQQKQTSKSWAEKDPNLQALHKDARLQKLLLELNK